MTHRAIPATVIKAPDSERMPIPSGNNAVLEHYRQLNNSFDKVLIFRLGQKAGFFSEYNNMLLAMEYCLEHSIKFSPYSRDATFGFNKGWRDYFLPFCRESRNRLHQRYNLRSSGSRLVRVYSKAMDRLKLPLLTQHLWMEIRSHKEPQCNPGNFFPERGGMRERLQLLHRMVWRYNEETSEEVDSLIEGVKMEGSYFGFHIRGGDKHVEHPLIGVEKYIEKALEVAAINSAFVLTDDYRIYEQLRERLPHWTVQTLCRPEQQGYFHRAYKKTPKEIVKRDHIRLFASMDLMEKSDHFFGSFSSNPGMHMGMRKGTESCFGVDLPEWCVW